MASLCVKVFVSGQDEDYHLFDGEAPCPNAECADEEEVHEKFNLESKIKDVKIVLQGPLTAEGVIEQYREKWNTAPQRNA